MKVLIEDLFDLSKANNNDVTLDITSVYIDVCENNGIEIIIRNMSAEPLHISGEQLTERFVRGDEARNTEGSGLGLAIAKSFVEIQKGSFEVIVDGDLFKASIRFKKY